MVSPGSIPWSEWSGRRHDAYELVFRRLAITQNCNFLRVNLKMLYAGLEIVRLDSGAIIQFAPSDIRSAAPSATYDFYDQLRRFRLHNWRTWISMIDFGDHNHLSEQFYLSETSGKMAGCRQGSNFGFKILRGCLNVEYREPMLTKFMRLSQNVGWSNLCLQFHQVVGNLLLWVVLFGNHSLVISRVMVPQLWRLMFPSPSCIVHL